VTALVRAAMPEVDVERSIRSVSCHLMAPVPTGDVTVTNTVLRAGSAMTTISTELIDAEGTMCAHLVSIWGSQRAMDAQPPYEQWGTAQMPTVPAWQDCDITQVLPPLGPEFAQNIEFRILDGFPMSGTTTTLGWIRLTPDGTQWQPDGASLLGLVDAWWPGAIAQLTELRPMATVAFSAQLLVDPMTLPTEAPLLHHGTVSAAIEGYTAETRRLWTADGRLAVENFQTITIIR
jgi:hypothetical protein